MLRSSVLILASVALAVGGAASQALAHAPPMGTEAEGRASLLTTFPWLTAFALRRVACDRNPSQPGASLRSPRWKKEQA